MNMNPQTITSSRNMRWKGCDMSDEYKRQIMERIKDSVNNWIDKLKKEHPELLLTKQWNVEFPKGFVSGHTVLLVLTGSKNGKRCVGEVQFMLPDNLELDMDAVELVLKNEQYNPKPESGSSVPEKLDDSLTVLNELIIGVNQFIKGISVPTGSAPKPMSLNTPVSPNSQPLRIFNNNVQTHTALNSKTKDEAITEIVRSKHMPEWFRMIDSVEVRSELLNKIADSLSHYENRLGKPVDLKEFFTKYTDHLLTQNTLHHYCKYKAKPVKLDSEGRCIESYCSRKQFNMKCSEAVVRFGKVTDF